MKSPKHLTGPVNLGNPKEFTIKELAELVIDMTESKSKAPPPVLIQPGPRNSLADVVGLFVGNAVDLNALTGVTVVLPDRPLLAAVDVRGGIPGTYHTDALGSGGLMRHISALVLTGGAAYGIDAVAGLTSWLGARGRGFAGWGAVIPLVCGAVIFDLTNGGNKLWGEVSPYRALADAAAELAAADFALGNAGAGLGAIAATLKGGLGTASAYDSVTGATVAALVVVNPYGSVTMPGSPTMWAWYLEQAGELGGQTFPTAVTGHAFEVKTGMASNTTIGVVATDAVLNHEDLQRLAMMSQDGYARAIRPVHTPFDGDTLFAISTEAVPVAQEPVTLLRLGTIAADVVARAIMRGVFHAADIAGHQSYATRWGAHLRGSG